MVGLFGVFDGQCFYMKFCFLCCQINTNVMLFQMYICLIRCCCIAKEIDLLEMLLVVLVFRNIQLSYSCCWNNAGHGGSRAAEFVKQNLFDNLLKHPKFLSDTKAAIGMHIFASEHF